jgi:hypothetical membrane protein
MRINKLLFWISFIGGILMICIGIVLQPSGYSSTEPTFSKLGAGSTTFSGTQSIILGVIILLMSAWNYRSWKTEAKERERRIIEENAPPEKRVKKNRFFRRLQKQNERNKI